MFSTQLLYTTVYTHYTHYTHTIRTLYTHYTHIHTHYIHVLFARNYFCDLLNEILIPNRFLIRFNRNTFYCVIDYS